MVEVDGAYFGVHRKHVNVKAEREDRCREVRARRQSVVVAQERGGRTLVTVASSEAAGASWVTLKVALGSVVHADEARARDRLHARYETRRINHSVAFSLHAPAPTKPSPSSLGCAGLRWASTTTSAENIFWRMPRKWRGARTTAASRTAPSLNW